MLKHVRDRLQHAQSKKLALIDLISMLVYDELGWPYVGLGSKRAVHQEHEGAPDEWPSRPRHDGPLLRATSTPNVSGNRRRAPSALLRRGRKRKCRPRR